LKSTLHSPTAARRCRPHVRVTAGPASRGPPATTLSARGRAAARPPDSADCFTHTRRAVAVGRRRCRGRSPKHRPRPRRRRRPPAKTRCAAAAAVVPLAGTGALRPGRGGVVANARDARGRGHPPRLRRPPEAPFASRALSRTATRRRRRWRRPVAAVKLGATTRRAPPPLPRPRWGRPRPPAAALGGAPPPRRTRCGAAPRHAPPDGPPPAGGGGGKQAAAPAAARTATQQAHVRWGAHRRPGVPPPRAHRDAGVTTTGATLGAAISVGAAPRQRRHETAGGAGGGGADDTTATMALADGTAAAERPPRKAERRAGTAPVPLLSRPRPCRRRRHPRSPWQPTPAAVMAATLPRPAPREAGR